MLSASRSVIGTRNPPDVRGAYNTDRMLHTALSFSLPSLASRLLSLVFCLSSLVSNRRSSARRNSPNVRSVKFSAGAMYLPHRVRKGGLVRLLSIAVRSVLRSHESEYRKSCNPNRESCRSVCNGEFHLRRTSYCLRFEL